MTQNHYLLCPLCRQHLTLNEKNALCPQGHNFDRARQGYLNLHPAPVKTLYSKTLYQARQHLCAHGIFDPLIAALTPLLLQYTPTPSPAILDAGCGDGSLLAALTQALRTHNRTPSSLGIDISKDAVKIAARANPALIWCVADLARPPIADTTQDIILNILAPANYSEFARLLKPAGLLVKVRPGPQHFQELRQTLQRSAPTPDSPAPPTSPANTGSDPILKPLPATPPAAMAHAAPFTVAAACQLTYDVSAVHNIDAFIQMSPLSWHIRQETKASALSGRLQRIRLDYMITLARLA